MDFLNRVLGIQVVYLQEEPCFTPNYIAERYRLQRVTLDGKKAIFLYPRQELDSVTAIKKHMKKIEGAEGARVILVLDRLSYRQKEYLLRDQIPFVVDGKQLYLPFMAAYLQERCDSEEREQAGMLPSAQVLLLYYIYQGCGELLTSEAARALSYTATSVSRASRQLEDMGLIRTEKRGVQKVICCDMQPKALFLAAKKSMGNPVKRSVYVSKTAVNTEMTMSGYSALAEYTVLNPPATECYAVDSIATWEKDASSRLHDSDTQCELELWRYDPKKLSFDGCVDRLSLALSFAENKDERVEEAVEEMLSKVWEELDGKRDR